MLLKYQTLPMKQSSYINKNIGKGFCISTTMFRIRRNCNQSLVKPSLLKVIVILNFPLNFNHADNMNVPNDCEIETYIL